MQLLCPTASRALIAPVETSLRQLMVEYQLDTGSNLLLSLGHLRDALAYYKIVCLPDIGTLGLDDSRVLALSAATPLSRTLDIIKQGETSTIEFKSSLLFDWNRFRSQTGVLAENCKLDALVHSVMKTIAAFANTDGGTLLVGVEDNGTVCGLQNDFEVVNPQRSNYDGWEQRLRSYIDSIFVEGRAVSSYVHTEPVRHEGLEWVSIQVAARKELTFIKNTAVSELYVRSGTRSVPILFHEIDKHYDMRRRF